MSDSRFMVDPKGWRHPENDLCEETGCKPEATMPEQGATEARATGGEGMSKPTDRCNHSELFLCNLCYHDIPPSSTMSEETLDVLLAGPEQPTKEQAK